MHVLIIPSWYKTAEAPVRGTFFEEQARGLQNKNCKVGIFHIGFKPMSYKEHLFQEEYDDNGLTTYYYEFKGIIPRSPKINYYYLCVKTYKLFLTYVQKNGKPDVIHAHSVFWGGIVARYISKKANIPYLITEHLTSFMAGSVTDKTDIQFSKKIFNDSAVNIVVSSIFKKELCEKLQLDPNKMKVVHNVVSPLFFNNLKPKTLNSSQTIQFFTSSFITERKNHKLLLKAFADFLKIYPNAELVIGGDGTNQEEFQLKNDLQKLCVQLNIHHKVSFLGSVTRMQTKEELDKCHIFLLASKYETFGVVLIEALAVGRPIITTNSKGPEDIITSSNGIMVNSWQVEDFTAAMIKIVENYADYNQAEISKLCQQKFGEDFIINQLIDIYRQQMKK